MSAVTATAFTDWYEDSLGYEPGHVCCPDCGCHPDDHTLHRGHCRRVFPAGHPYEHLQFGPPWQPWPVADRVLKDARLSPDGVYRYELTRTWDLTARLPLDTWIALNPSTADAEVDDRTIGRCIAFSQRWGAGGIRVVNLFALRSVDPNTLRRHPDPIGDGNDAAIARAVCLTRASEGRTVVAWGSHVMAVHRARHVRDLVGGPLLCLGTTRGNHPRHPLYVRGDTPLERWRPR